MNISQTTLRIGAILGTISAIVVLAASAQAATSKPAEMSQPEYRALMIRSDALNKQYGLGAYAPATTGSAASTSEPTWLRALRLRSEALNKQYGLGAFAHRTTSAPLGDEPAWLHAMRIRSEALNRQYKLGEYASETP